MANYINSIREKGRLERIEERNNTHSLIQIIATTYNLKPDYISENIDFSQLETWVEYDSTNCKLSLVVKEDVKGDYFILSRNEESYKFEHYRVD